MVSSHELLQDFLTVVVDSQGSAARVLSAWLAEPDRFLGETKYTSPVQLALKSMPPEHLKDALTIADYASRLSVYMLCKRLAEGDEDLEFKVLARKSTAGDFHQVLGAPDGVGVDMVDDLSP